ncbi:hypothetical protein [Actinomadura sp. DC4]|uniref:hypothetical protein n=1 Tax=Actinomadura sp. DC4 TaxID=3055069 RepID=UPI0025B14716|nr:hypothetical protein [Actinomadura sp. DC4]MDN3353185.1 hypothetical protein [Actinomadura sp. DC4]
MSAGAGKYKSDFARRHYEMGMAAGMAAGMAKGTARVLLIVLSVHGIEVSEEAQVRISECPDLEQLESWLRLAVTVEIDALEDLLGSA